MEIAQQRINEWTSGPLDLSRLGLTELPDLPSGLQTLNCSQNQLTQLDNLPSGLQKLWCDKMEIHVCTPEVCSCKKLPTFYKTKILATKYDKYYNEVLSEIIHEPHLASVVTSFIQKPYKKCFQLYG